MKSTIAVLLALLMALTACGAKEQSNAGKENKEDPIKFAQCMRENGVNMPDPKEGEGGGVVIEASPGDSGPLDEGKFKSAHEACKQYLKDGGEFKPPSPEEQDKMRQQAKCMRDKGYNWPDPKFEGGGAAETMELPNLDDDKVKQDMKDCGLPEMRMGRAVG
ncbi:hypothetical protein [Lentzea aerocolonigenes]|uniref:hypothetical protein n=1 Tax=Lentzea aerocolonigenes TaxID=68170 RepID=UPI00068E05A1|nr:hypothetical protein [Lentzea aerocolonigenes]MCP2250275.1 hypothetical protein [Lentzea aerocolonigenes]